MELLEMAEGLLPEVCELTKDAAENYARASSKSGFSKSPRAEKASSYEQTTPNDQKAGEDEEKSPLSRVLDEPVSIRIDDEHPPMIPVSLLDLERFSITLQIQLIMQKFAKYAEASPKARSNAAYIAGLRAMIEEMMGLVKRKLDLEGKWVACNDRISLVDIHPKLISDQLTLLDARIYQTLKLELLYQSEPGRSFAQASRDIGKFITAVVIFEVLAPRDRQDRIRALYHWIRVSSELKGRNSFNVLKAVADGVCSDNIRKAKGLIEGLSTNQEFDLRKIRETNSIKANFKRMREAMDSVNIAATPFLPYINIYLSDLDMLHSTKAIPKGPERSKEISAIVQRLVDCQIRCEEYLKTIEPDQVAQHWILTRPYKNSQELDNLAVSRSESGGMYSPSSKSDSSRGRTPDIIDFADEGTIMLGNLHDRIFSQAKISQRPP